MVTGSTLYPSISFLARMSSPWMETVSKISRLKHKIEDQSFDIFIVRILFVISISEKCLKDIHIRDFIVRICIQPLKFGRPRPVLRLQEGPL